MLNISQDEVNKFVKMVAPARLTDTIENAAAIAQYVKSHNLPHNADSCLRAVHALLFQDSALTWDVKPQKLLAFENMRRPTIIPNAPDLQEHAKWTVKIQAHDISDAKAKNDAASIQRAKDLISSFNPVSRGMYDHSAREEAQKSWTAALDRAIAEKVNLQNWVEVLAAAIQKRYRDRAKASEKM